jgi:hypothetical protein
VPPNVWVGVSIEDHRLLPRMEALARGAAGATVRFISYEPALGPLAPPPLADAGQVGAAASPDAAAIHLARRLIGNQVTWLICGAESGPGARPMELDWARQARDACHAAGVPFFFKQVADEFGHMTQLPALDVVVWDQMPAAYLPPPEAPSLQTMRQAREHIEALLWARAPQGSRPLRTHAHARRTTRGRSSRTGYVQVARRPTKSTARSGPSSWRPMRTGAHLQVLAEKGSMSRPVAQMVPARASHVAPDRWREHR